MSRPTIAYFVHGRGLGHGSRTLATVPQLRAAGFDVHVYGAGDALAMLDGQPGVHPIELCAPGREMPRIFARRARADVARLRELQPGLVVSDGDGPSVHAALRLGIPSVAVSHGLVFGHCKLPPGLPLKGVLRERVNAASSSWPSARRVAVHFAPLRPRTAGTRVARPDLHVPAREKVETEDFLLAYFRDPVGDHELHALRSRGHRIVCFGETGRRVPGVEYRPVSGQGFAELLPRAKGVVGSAGNHLPAECAMLEKPMLALYREHDMEHAMNAHLIQGAGIGVACALGSLGADRMLAFERALEVDRSELARATHALPPASEVTVEVCSELLGAPAVVRGPALAVPRRLATSGMFLRRPSGLLDESRPSRQAP